MTIDLDAYYKVDEYRGIAWYLVGYAKEYTQESWEYVGPDDPDDEALNDPENYIYDEPEEIEDRTRVIAVMVGDDRKFTFDISQLTKLDEEEFCHGCGQIGCGWH